jgi:hypothetical protein
MIPRLLLAMPLLILAGCVGNLDIWGINVDIPGEGDDDDAAPDIDFTSYDGFEFINIDWDQQRRPGGVEDCIEDDGWNVHGDETTVDDQSRCPACDHIWTLTYIATSGLGDCLASTGLSADTAFQRKLGFEFQDAQGFRVWRNFEDPDVPLQLIGEGALQDDASHTWSGSNGYRLGDAAAYDYYFSGEGAF